MIEQMKKKLSDSHPLFSDEEVGWLMENIGSPDAAIRDDSVFQLFSKSISASCFNRKQFLFLKDSTICQNLAFYKMEEQLPASLTRSFAALLNGFILEADNDPHSSYFELLTDMDRTYLFDGAVEYLKRENDFTGYSEQFGWVHCFAHGADWLLKAIRHNRFSGDRLKVSLASIENVFQRLPCVFTDGEERRLAAAVYEPLISGKLSQKMVAGWLASLYFPVESYIDISRLMCFESFLAAIYFHLEGSIGMTSQLKNGLMEYLKNY